MESSWWHVRLQVFLAWDRIAATHEQVCVHSDHQQLSGEHLLLPDGGADEPGSDTASDVGAEQGAHSTANPLADNSVANKSPDESPNAVSHPTPHPVADESPDESADPNAEHAGADHPRPDGVPDRAAHTDPQHRRPVPTPNGRPHPGAHHVRPQCSAFADPHDPAADRRSDWHSDRRTDRHRRRGNRWGRGRRRGIPALHCNWRWGSVASHGVRGDPDPAKGGGEAAAQHDGVHPRDRSEQKCGHRQGARRWQRPGRPRGTTRAGEGSWGRCEQCSPSGWHRGGSRRCRPWPWQRSRSRSGWSHRSRPVGRRCRKDRGKDRKKADPAVPPRNPGRQDNLCQPGESALSAA